MCHKTVACTIVLLSAHVAAAQSCSIDRRSPMAQGCAVSGAVGIHMPALLDFAIDVRGATTTPLAARDASVDFSDDGTVTKESAGPTYAIRSNRTWRLMVKSSSAMFGTTPSRPKPSSDVTVRVGSKPYAELTTIDREVDAGGRTFVALSQAINYRTTYYLSDDVPGEYGIGLTFTVTAP